MRALSIHGNAKPLLPLSSTEILARSTAVPLTGLTAQNTDSESSRDNAILLTSGVPLSPSACSCTVPNICSLRAAGCNKCGWQARGSASSTGAWYGSGGVQPNTVVESVRTKKLKTKWMACPNKQLYYMATIVCALWLAAERARFSCNDRALWKFFSALVNTGQFLLWKLKWLNLP